MYVRAPGTAVPPRRYTKADCLRAFMASEWHARLQSRSVALVRAVLEREYGMDAHRLALEDLSEVFEVEPDMLSHRFFTHAPDLAARAGARALARAGQALQHLLPMGVPLGLQASYLNQPVQVAALRPKLQQLAGSPGHAQWLLRIGAPTQVKPAAPRRPVAEVLVTAP